MVATWSANGSSAEAAVIGVDFGGTKIEIALADRTGHILERTRIATDAAAGPTAAFARVGTVISRLTKRVEHEHGLSVQSLGAVSPGVVQADGIALAPNLPGWGGVALATEMGQLLGSPKVAVSNDVKAAALAELRFGALRGVDPGLYLNLGTGIGAAACVGGQVVQGHHQAAGEIAYVVTDVASASPTPLQHPQLEQLIGGQGLSLRAERFFGQRTDAAALFASTDPRAINLIQHALTVLATSLANMSVLLDPQRIAIGGGLTAAAATILPVVRVYLEQYVPFPPELVLARFVEDASLRGAIALALDRLTQPSTSDPIGAQP